MELLEAVFIFSGRYRRLFHSPADAGIGDGRVLLRGGAADDSLYHCPEAAVRRSCIRMAFAGVHYPDDQRGTVLLHRDIGAVSCQDLYGGEKAPHLPDSGEMLGLRKRQRAYREMPGIKKPSRKEGQAESLNDILAP